MDMAKALVHVADSTGTTCRTFAGIRQTAPREFPSRDMQKQAKDELTNDADKWNKIYRTVSMPNVLELLFPHGRGGWGKHPIRVVQEAVISLHEEFPDAPEWTDLADIILEFAFSGDAHNTDIGTKGRTLTAFTLRCVSKGFPRAWQSPKWTFTIAEIPGKDSRENMKANGRAIFEVLHYMLKNKIPVFLRDAVRMVQIVLFFPGDMSYLWQLRGCGGLHDKHGIFCHLCEMLSALKQKIFALARPQPNETLEQFFRRHFMGLREGLAINQHHTHAPQRGPAWELEKQLQHHTIDGEGNDDPRVPTINVNEYAPVAGDAAPPPPSAARSSRARAARDPGGCLPTNGLLRVHILHPMTRQLGADDLVRGVEAWRFAFDIEHCITRIVESLVKQVQQAVISSKNTKKAIERFNERMEEIGSKMRIKADPTGANGYKEVHISGGEARKLLKEHERWLPVLNLDATKLAELTEIWRLLTDINETGRNPDPTDEENAMFEDNCKRFHRLVIMQNVKETTGSFYLHALGCHGGELQRLLRALWRLAQSGVENKHKEANRQVRNNSAGEGGATGTTAGRVIGHNPHTGAAIREKGVYRQVPNECALQIMQREQRKSDHRLAPIKKKYPELQTWLESSDSLPCAYDYAANGHQSWPEYQEAVNSYKARGLTSHDEEDMECPSPSRNEEDTPEPPPRGSARHVDDAS
eukprot:jgi/Mesvir1/8069/Mv10520-RA.1